MTKKKNVGLAGVLGMQSKPHEAKTENRVESRGRVKPVSKAKPASKAKAVKPKVIKEASKPAASAKNKALPKSKDKDFKLTGVYLRKTTVGQVKARLELSEQDMSELMEDLLVKWLKTK